MKNRILIPSLLLLSLTALQAVVKPNNLFSDNAVLQQGIPVPVWGTANNGEKVTVTFAGQKAETVAKEGKWKVVLPALKASETPQTMAISGENKIEIKNLLVGEVWVCGGQSNMQFAISGKGSAITLLNSEEVLKSINDPLLRLLTVPRHGTPEPQSDVVASWNECTSQTAADFSAVAYFFGRDLRKAEHVPVGLISSNVGGTAAEQWTSRNVLESNPELRGIFSAHEKALQEYPAVLDKFKADEPKLLEKWNADCEKAKADGKPAPRKPAAPASPASRPPVALYNAMIAPLQPFAIKGVIWYQGESNSSRARQYQTLFPAMIKCWRDAWGQGEFPFLFVQVAPYNGMIPEIREAQLISWKKTPNTAMAVTTDVGAPYDIHPKQKEPVGARLALAARALAYGEKLEYSGPVFDALKMNGNKATLTFTHLGGGLVAKDGALKGFTIAGADKKFVPATAEIIGEQVVVSSPQIAAPVAVRYGWANCPDVNLFNKAGLPATPFRTDSEEAQVSATTH